MSKLEKLVEKGYVLHGSKSKFDIAKPNKKARVPEGGGQLNAIYTTDIPLISMFKSITRPQKTPAKKGVAGWRIFKNRNVRFRLTPNYLKYDGFGDGYVYAFKKEDFVKDKKIPHEFYSKERQRPKYTFLVKPEDFLKFAKITKWKKDEVRKAGFHTEEEIQKMFM